MPVCEYGSRCYRKNPEHVKEFHAAPVPAANSTKKVADKKEPSRGLNQWLNKANDSEKKRVVVVGGQGKVNRQEPIVANEPAAKRVKTTEKAKSPEIVEVVSVPTPRTTTRHQPHREAEPSKWVPRMAVEFWKFAKTNNPSRPEDLPMSGAFVPRCKTCLAGFQNARLVGPFRILAGEEGLDPLMVDRNPLDLPEMQTFLTYDQGRYCYWRDEPDEKSPLIVHASNEDFLPRIEVVGDRMEHVVWAFAGASEAKKYVPGGKGVDTIEAQVKAVKTKRAKKKVGSAPHGVGIYVHVTDRNVGYRSLSATAVQMRRKLTTIRTTSNEEERKVKINSIYQEIIDAQIANDEADFGCPLELGHWLFLANSEHLDKMCTTPLWNAYESLNRKEFFNIAKETLKLREELRSAA